MRGVAVSGTASKIESLQAERQKLQARLREIADELTQLESIRHAEQIRELVDQPDAVKLAFRWHPDPKAQAYIGKPGTLVEVRRTRCSVVFGDGLKWNLKLEDVIPATADATAAVVALEGAE